MEPFVDKYKSAAMRGRRVAEFMSGDVIELMSADKLIINL